MDKYPPAFLAALEKVTAKRARTVIDHILKHGHITTEELKDTYGYDHPPRAARDVREEGIPLETFTLKGAHGRSIAAYRFGDISKVEKHKLGGRTVFSKQVRKVLYDQQHSRCAVCFLEYEERYLQVDHRVPYEVAGDQVADESQTGAFMMICGSCQRSKSWSCEHCSNWQQEKRATVCRKCYWGDPESYEHIGTLALRREVVIWSGPEVSQHERLKKRAAAAGVAVVDFIKAALK